MTTQALKRGGAEMAGTAGQAAGQVAGTVRQQAGRVAEEAAGLMSQAQQEISQQAGEQAQRLGAGLRQAARQLSSMADSGEAAAAAESVLRQLADTSERAAGYVESHGPADVVGDVRQLGRRRLGLFLAVAGLAGFVVGRITKAARRGPDARSLPVQAPPGARREEVLDLTEGARTVEATTERAGSAGLGPYSTGV